MNSRTLSIIQGHLNLMDKEVAKKKCVILCYLLSLVIIITSYRYLKGKDLTKFKRDCHSYFIEVVSTLCFGGENAPEPTLIKNLMELEDMDLVSPVIVKKSDKRSKSSKISVVRSSLLQLLLEHK